MTLSSFPSDVLFNFAECQRRRLHSHGDTIVDGYDSQPTPASLKRSRLLRELSAVSHICDQALMCPSSAFTVQSWADAHTPREISKMVSCSESCKPGTSCICSAPGLLPWVWSVLGSHEPVSGSKLFLELATSYPGSSYLLPRKKRSRPGDSGVPQKAAGQSWLVVTTNKIILEELYALASSTIFFLFNKYSWAFHVSNIIAVPKRWILKFRFGVL